MYRIMTVIGTRPEIIKLSRVIFELDNQMEHILVHTGQNYDYELNQVFFEDLDLRKPDYFLDAAAATSAETIANVIRSSDELLARTDPDALLVYGDTNSVLCVISAKKRKIPIFHMEAGNRCFDERVPEETNRRIVDHISDINMTLTEHARRYLLAEGLRPERVFNVGSSMPEVLHYYRDGLDKSDVLERLGLEKERYILVSSHREENIEDATNFRQFSETLMSIAERYNLQVVVSAHPRTQKKLASEKIVLPSSITIAKPFGFFDYLCLQSNSYCVLSDSGTIFEESSILKFPAVTIRNSHERPEGIDSGALVLSGLESERVCTAIDLVVSQQRSGFRAELPRDYAPLDVSKKVVRILAGYIDYVNQTVWRKNN